MARARTIKPAFFKNEDLSECSFAARLLFVGLWTLADRDGILEYRPKRLKAELFPYDEAVKLHDLAVELSGKKFIVMYENSGINYILIPTFQKHQKPHPKEASCKYPQPTDPPRVCVEAVEKSGQPDKIPARSAFPSSNPSILQSSNPSAIPSSPSFDPLVPQNSEPEKNPASNGKTMTSREKSDQVRQVFDHFRTHHPRAFPTPKPESKEWRLILARMNEGFTDQDLCDAIDGMHRTPHNCGVNDSQQTFLSLELCMRSGSHVTKYMQAPQQLAPIMSEKEMRGQIAGQQFLERFGTDG